MKKRILSILAVLVLMLSIMPMAFADINTNLGSFTAGVSISQPIFEYSEDYTYEQTTLPYGCNIEVVNGKVCLTGTAVVAGNYDFDIMSGDVKYVCHVEIAPYTPSCTVSGDVSGAINDNIVVTVSASVKDQGALSYQWYSNTVRSVVGGSPIAGAVGSAYTASTAVSGKTYYYCNITNVNNGLSINVFSDVVEVTVNEPDVSNVTISKTPDRIKYKVGDTVDTTGLVLNVEYANGSVKTVTTDYTVTPKQITQDTKGIWITYKGKEAYFAIELEEQLSATVFTMPTKTEYTVGDLLETEGLVLKLTGGANGQELINSGFSCSPLRLDTVGTQVITVTYKNVTCNYAVKVNEKGKDIINVVTRPTKLEYTVGDKLDLTGIVIELKSGSKSTSVTTGFTAEPMELTKAGIQTITVKYNDLTASFTVNVKEAAAVTATPAPTDAIRPTPAPSNKGDNAPGMNIHQMLVVFIIILAVMAVITLGIYIYVARSKNIDESPLGKFFEKLREFKNDHRE